MTQRSDIPHIRDMRLFARKTLSFVEGMTFSQFEQSDLHQHATIKTIETIGEAATEVSAAFRRLIRKSIGRRSSACGTASFTGAAA